MELVCQTFNKYMGDDIRTAVSHYQRGDVIEEGLDGAVWGKCVVHNPAFVILRVDISESRAKALKSKEPGDPLTNPILRRRLDHVDLDVLASLGYPMPSETKAREMRYPGGKDTQDYLALPENPVIQVKADDFEQAISRKIPLPNPLVLGGADPSVLGG